MTLSPVERSFWQRVYVVTAARPGNGATACAHEADRAVEELRKRQGEQVVAVTPGRCGFEPCVLHEGHDGAHTFGR